jgi:ketosteroid isomerase-like protein
MKVCKLVTVWLLFAMGIIATGTKAIGQSKTEAAIIEAVEKLKNAMISGNRAELEAIAADKLSYGHSGGTIDDKQQFVEKIASGASDFVAIELKNQSIVVSGKTAIVRHELHAQTNDGGKPGEVHLRVMLVFQQDDGKWKMLGRQAVKM